jgi:hypothetical protein
MKDTVKQKISLIIVLVFIFLGIFYFSQIKKNKNISPSGTPSVFIEGSSLVATITEISSENNFLVISPVQEEYSKLKIKIIPNENTKISQLKFPFDPQSSPPDNNFELKEEKISIGELKVGGRVLIQTNQNIGSKAEIYDVYSVQILP